MGTLIDVTGGARKAISMDSLIGNRLAGRYDIQSWIGQGGMGIVYRGYDAMLKRVVAIKVLPLQLTIDPAFVQRFRQEAVIAANLRHSNIVTIYDVGTQPGDRPELSVYYIVMEYLEGVTLDQWIAQNGSMTLEQVSHVVGQVAEALDYAHEQGLIHRDIKPSNVMIGPKGKATLMDFGLVRAGEGGGLTRNSVIMGTPEYMAPEQALGQPIDSRADIYSLGAVIYKLFIGSAPFRAHDAHGDRRGSRLRAACAAAQPASRPAQVGRSGDDESAGQKAGRALPASRRPGQGFGTGRHGQDAGRAESTAHAALRKPARQCARSRRSGRHAQGFALTAGRPGDAAGKARPNTGWRTQAGSYRSACRCADGTRCPAQPALLAVRVAAGRHRRPGSGHPGWGSLGAQQSRFQHAQAGGCGNHCPADVDADGGQGYADDSCGHGHLKATTYSGHSG